MTSPRTSPRPTVRHAIALALAAALTLAPLLTGCQESRAGEPGRRALARLERASNSSVQGEVLFEEQSDGLRIVATLHGLEPGLHGFHIHAHGDCSAEDASSAGGHFAPDGHPHGSPDDAPADRHAGDLGNVRADADGHVRHEMVDGVLRLDGRYGVIGKAVVVHAEADDFTTQPSGNAGERVACGVVQPD